MKITLYQSPNQYYIENKSKLKKFLTSYKSFAIRHLEESSKVDLYSSKECKYHFVVGKYLMKVPVLAHLIVLVEWIAFLVFNLLPKNINELVKNNRISLSLAKSLTYEEQSLVLLAAKEPNVNLKALIQLVRLHKVPNDEVVFFFASLEAPKQELFLDKKFIKILKSSSIDIKQLFELPAKDLTYLKQNFIYLSSLNEQLTEDSLLELMAHLKDYSLTSQIVHCDALAKALSKNIICFEDLKKITPDILTRLDLLQYKEAFKNLENIKRLIDSPELFPIPDYFQRLGNLSSQV